MNKTAPIPAIKKRLIHIILFTAAYLLAFYFLEKRECDRVMLDMAADRAIPFLSGFIIPYTAWYLFVPAVILAFAVFDRDGKEYRALAVSLASGCVLFIAVSYIFPNGHSLRPVLEGNGIFERAVMLLHSIDPPTNILPSIHVYSSAACCIAVCKSNLPWSRSAVKPLSLLLTCAIIVSTLFIKQHTIIDVVSALALNLICTAVVYK